MHIPTEMLTGAICPVSAAVAATGVASAAIALFARKDKLPSPTKFALVSAAIFGIQMLNYPIWDGISGHIIGGVLAAALLGVPAAVLSLALVLILQTLLFADGGLSMLGANIVNMSLIGAGVGGLLRLVLLKFKLSSGLATGIASCVAVELAALALAAELFFDGKASLSVCGTLLGVHALLAVIEGAFTALALGALKGAELKETSNRREYAILSVAIVAAVCLSPFASSFPDAFEWTMSSLLPTAPNFVNAPFADYEISGITNGFLSTLSAASLGAFAAFALGYLLLKAVSSLKSRVAA